MTPCRFDDVPRRKLDLIRGLDTLKDDEARRALLRRFLDRLAT